MRWWTSGISVALIWQAVASCSSDSVEDAQGRVRDDCSVVEAYPLDIDNACFSAKLTVDGICLLEEQPDGTSGIGTTACLIAPDGAVYYVDHYGYTQTLEAEGWNVYDIDHQANVAPHEHPEAPLPSSCAVGKGVLLAALERCVDNADGNLEACDTGGNAGFTPQMAHEVESACEAAQQDAGAL